ncbi:AraC family transcriptional regulator [Methylobacterium sp. GC_Met_2]|uniref:AraC family transcriptional regulator n=1 Tax=Methylobacterium sp. GC_Met_2 TaxID=2937376 RepID=UPI00226B96C5|nr:AraC family transcriptional regulator [Methylobacterium sp. GC_Met_2]
MAGLVAAVRQTSALVRDAPARLIHRVRHGDDHIRMDPANAVTIVMNLSESHSARCRLDGRAATTEPFVGAVTLVPPGSPAAFTLTGTANVLMMQVPWSSVRQVAETEGRDAARVEVRPRIAFDDPVLAHLLYAAAATPDGEVEPVEPVIVRLLAAHDTRHRAGVPALGGLTPNTLRRVRARVEASPEDPPSLDELATEAGLSMFHFAREFHRSTGSPPHRFILRRQLDRATMLLADRNMAVADVAAAAGFAHASHLARHLRRRTGLSPDAFRTRILP